MIITQAKPSKKTGENPWARPPEGYRPSFPYCWDRGFLWIGKHLQKHEGEKFI